jgi:hypothetical protein
MLMVVASLRGPPFGNLTEVQSRPFSAKPALMEDAGLPFSGDYNHRSTIQLSSRKHNDLCNN